MKIETLPSPARLDLAVHRVITPTGDALVALDGERWCFAGFPEQAVFADPGQAEALALGHWPDARARYTGDAPAPVAWTFLLAMDGDDVPDMTLAVRGTPLQVAVWRALMAIPRGVTISYSELAARVDHPRATRAVASAVGANPLSGLIPCHRVRRRDGTPGGYRWGLATKERLLAREKSASAFPSGNIFQG